MIHYFHGFLGSPEDFSEIKPQGISHSLLSLPTEDQIKEDDTLIGYSMGGRVATEIAVSKKFQIKKLILLASHPGIEESEREERILSENKIIHLMEKYPKDQFLDLWNKLPLFEGDPELTPNNLTQEENLDLFKKFRLSQQSNFKEVLKKHKNKVVYVVGEKDHKYKSLAENFFIKEGFKCHFLPVNHRLIKYPSLLSEILQKECE